MEGGHEDGPPSTRNLYMVDEVLSAMQKAIRRSLHEETLFWTNELHISGLGALAMARFGVMCSEDLSIGCPALPQYILQARREYYTHVKKNAHAESGRVLLECAHVLSHSGKNRMPATAAVWLYARMEQELAQADAAVRQGGDARSKTAHWLLWPLQARVTFLKDSMHACLADPRQLLAHEQNALLAMQSLFLEDKHVQIWRALLAMKPHNPTLKDAMAALYTLVQERGCSAERYCMIHAILLFTRQALFSPPSLQPIRVPTTPLPSEILAMHPGRSFAVPRYAIDKHTRRGGVGGRGVPGKSVKGRGTLEDLKDAAKYWRVDVTKWSDAEVAKSHGEGVERASDTSVGPETLLSHFFRDGVVVADEYIPVPSGARPEDPYREGAQHFNLELERRCQGPLPKGLAREQQVERLRSLRRLQQQPSPLPSTSAASFPALPSADCAGHRAERGRGSEEREEGAMTAMDLGGGGGMGGGGGLAGGGQEHGAAGGRRGEGGATRGRRRGGRLQQAYMGA